MTWQPVGWLVALTAPGVAGLALVTARDWRGASPSGRAMGTVRLLVAVDNRPIMGKA